MNQILKLKIFEFIKKFGLSKFNQILKKILLDPIWTIMMSRYKIIYVTLLGIYLFFRHKQNQDQVEIYYKKT